MESRPQSGYFLCRGQSSAHGSRPTWQLGQPIRNLLPRENKKWTLRSLRALPHSRLEPISDHPCLFFGVSLIARANGRQLSASRIVGSSLGCLLERNSISLSLCRKAQQYFSWTTAHVGKLNVPWALSRLHRDQLASSVACSIEHRIFSATGGFANAWCTIVTFFENNCLARILCDWVWTRLHRIAARDGCHDRRNQHCTLH